MIDLSKKDISILIRAIKQVWPRTERYKQLLHSFRTPDNSTARTTYWYTCNECKEQFRQKDIQLDHIEPVVPLDKTTYDLPIAEYIDRRCNSPWDNHQILCKPCHRTKSAQERKLRRKSSSKT